MRTVEKNLIRLLRQDKTGKASSNTEVKRHPEVRSYLQVYLFGKHIATYSTVSGNINVKDAGWRTVTTKSRLNALLGAFAPGYGITQRKHQWYLLAPGGNEGPWHGSAGFVRTSDPAQPVHLAA